MSPCGVAVGATVSVGVINGARVSVADGAGVSVGKVVGVVAGVAVLGLCAAEPDGLVQPGSRRMVKIQQVRRKKTN